MHPMPHSVECGSKLPYSTGNRHDQLQLQAHCARYKTAATVSRPGDPPSRRRGGRAPGSSEDATMATSSKGGTARTPGGDAGTKGTGSAGRKPGNDAGTKGTGSAGRSPGGDAGTKGTGSAGRKGR
jgi:hypothetical protein